MKRKLITQILTEWKSNLWLVVELVIVLVVTQFLFSILVNTYKQQRGDRGYDLSDIYIASLNVVESDSPRYMEYDDKHSEFTDRDVILANLRNNRYVELVGLAPDNSLPYNLSYYGSSVCLTEGDSVYEFPCNIRTMTPELIKVLRITGINGETPEELAAVLERDELILCPPDEEYIDECRKWYPGFADPQIMIGKQVHFYNDSVKTWRAGALAHGLRRRDYEPLAHGGVLYRNNRPDNWCWDIAIRVKPGSGDDFLASINPEDKKMGNVSITGIRSIERMGQKANLKEHQLIRNITVVALFLLLVIFLGFLGTFWFRTQQRYAEIAIRKVNGASNGDISRRFIGEGMILLLVAVIIATPCVVMLNSYEFINQMINIEIANQIQIVGFTASVIAVAILIICGIWAPAHKATKVDPSYALSDQ